MHEAPCSQRNNLALDSQRLKLLSWGKTVGSQDVSLPHAATRRPGAVGVHVCVCVCVCVCAFTHVLFGNAAWWVHSSCWR